MSGEDLRSESLGQSASVAGELVATMASSAAPENPSEMQTDDALPFEGRIDVANSLALGPEIAFVK